MKNLLLVFCLILGCASLEKASDGRFKYHKYLDKYNITVIIHRNSDGLCLMREVILDHESGMRFNAGDSPSYVRALDYGCDEVFDFFIFRDPVEKDRTDFRLLSQKLNFYFYLVAPIEQHAPYVYF